MILVTLSLYASLYYLYIRTGTICFSWLSRDTILVPVVTLNIKSFLVVGGNSRDPCARRHTHWLAGVSANRQQHTHMWRRTTITTTVRVIWRWPKCGGCSIIPIVWSNNNKKNTHTHTHDIVGKFSDVVTSLLRDSPFASKYDGLTQTLYHPRHKSNDYNEYDTCRAQSPATGPPISNIYIYYTYCEPWYCLLLPHMQKRNTCTPCTIHSTYIPRRLTRNVRFSQWRWFILRGKFKTYVRLTYVYRHKPYYSYTEREINWEKTCAQSFLSCVVSVFLYILFCVIIVRPAARVAVRERRSGQEAGIDRVCTWGGLNLCTTYYMKTM